MAHDSKPMIWHASGLVKVGSRARWVEWRDSGLLGSLMAEPDIKRLQAHVRAMLDEFFREYDSANENDLRVYDVYRRAANYDNFDVLHYIIFQCLLISHRVLARVAAQTPGHIMDPFMAKWRTINKAYLRGATHTRGTTQHIVWRLRALLAMHWDQYGKAARAFRPRIFLLAPATVSTDDAAAPAPKRVRIEEDAEQQEASDCLV